MHTYPNIHDPYEQQRRDAAAAHQHEHATPLDWGPLERIIAAHDLDPRPWMHMGNVRSADGTRIELYKHADTRRYLNLDAGGNAWRYVVGADEYSAGGYEPIELAAAITHATSL